MQRCWSDNLTVVILAVGCFALPLAQSDGKAETASVFDVMKFGAVGDGVHDDRGAIQQAIDQAARTGGVVLLPEPKQAYLVGGTLKITKSRVTLRGINAVIRLADGAADGTRDQRSTEGQVHVILASGSGQVPISDLRLEGLTIDANIHEQSDYYNPRGIVFEHVHDSVVENVQVQNAFVAMDFGVGCLNVEARDCVAEAFTEDGFDASGDAHNSPGGTSRFIRFLRCEARDAPDSGGNAWEIEDGVRHVLVQDCRVRNVGGNGFGIRNHWNATDDHSRHIILHRVQIEQVGGKYGIYTHSAPPDRSPDNSLDNVVLRDVECSAAMLAYGPMSQLHIHGGRFRSLWLGWEYGPKTTNEPGPPLPVAGALIENTVVGSLRLHAGGRSTPSNIIVRNVLVDAEQDETADDAVSISGDGDGISLINCTIVGATGAAFKSNGSAAAAVTHSIIWGNTTVHANSTEGDDTAALGTTFTRSCIEGGVPDSARDGGGNTASDPHFVKGPAGSYYLEQSVGNGSQRSPCLDAGFWPSKSFHDLHLRTTDPSGRDHRDTGRVDLGFHYPLQNDPEGNR